MSFYEVRIDPFSCCLICVRAEPVIGQLVYACLDWRAVLPAFFFRIWSRGTLCIMRCFAKTAFKIIIYLQMNWKLFFPLSLQGHYSVKCIQKTEGLRIFNRGGLGWLIFSEHSHGDKHNEQQGVTSHNSPQEVSPGGTEIHKWGRGGRRKVKFITLNSQG